jgi:hypothetical protein
MPGNLSRGLTFTRISRNARQMELMSAVLMGREGCENMLKRVITVFNQLLLAIHALRIHFFLSLAK